VDLIVLVNGVSVITGTDNTASRSIAGSPGMHRFQYTSVAVPGTSTVVCDNYSCGKL
jgi:hypothetical protein